MSIYGVASTAYWHVQIWFWEYQHTCMPYMVLGVPANGMLIQCMVLGVPAYRQVNTTYDGGSTSIAVL